MTAFLYAALEETDDYRPEVISLALSSRDEASVRLRAPKTWRNGPRVMRRTEREIDHCHVGAWFTEIEPFRYRPRSVLNEVLSKFDLIQFVVGNPPWGFVATELDRPVFLWTATTVWEDRRRRLRVDSGPRGWWRRAMTQRARVYEQRALRRMETVFALSQYTGRKLESDYGIESTVAPQGIDTSQFSPISEPEEDYILTVSRINDPRKRIPLLFEAYAEAKRTSESVPALYVVGGEPSAELRSKTLKLGIDESVRFLGALPQSELISLYQNALCFVLSSDEEGLGIVILEAMASGRPVVSTRCGGPETLIEDRETGFLTPVGDAEALGRKMVKLAERPSLRAKMGEAARRRTKEHFSVEAAKQPFLETYAGY